MNDSRANLDNAVNDSLCALCGSANLGRFLAETAIHLVGSENLNKPAVFVFSELRVCFHCGFAAFALPEEQLGILAIGNKEQRCGSKHLLNSFSRH